MTKPPWKNIRLFTALMIGVALIFSACSCLENYLLHPASEQTKVNICLALEKYVSVADVDALKKALNDYDPQLYYIIVRRTEGGPDEPPLGNPSEDCCKPAKMQKHKGRTPSSTTVTQRVKYQTGARGRNSEAAFKEIVQLLGKSK
jgi:hypothetical protein